MNLKRLRVQVMLRVRFCGSMLHNIAMVEDRNIPTACIDSNLVARFNPDFMDKLDDHEQIFVVCHELFHAMFLHVFRIFEWSDKRYVRVGNVAADYLVNYMLVEMGLKRPKNGTLYNTDYTPDKYTLEALTKKLIAENPPPPPGGSGGECIITGISDGNDIVEADGVEGKEKDTRGMEEKLRGSLTAAIMQAKKQGNLPGSLTRMCDELLNAKVNWRDALGEWFNTKVRSERTWKKPNRKAAWRGVYSPTTASLGCGHVGIAVDVSGSINQETLDVFSSELNHLFEQCKPSKITVCYFDTQKYIKEFDELPIKLETIGGGGTAFNIPITYFNDEVDEPISGLVFMTDMYGSWPKQEPEYPLLVLSITKDGGDAPYGRTIYCEP